MTGPERSPGIADPLETERFSLRSLSAFEAFRLTSRHWRTDAEILANVGRSSRVKSPLKWFFSMQRPNGRSRFTFAIHAREDGGLIGLHQVKLSHYRTASFAVAIHNRGWWGKGVVAEVRRALIDRLFAQENVDRIYCQVNARNFPSVFNYRKLGFAHVGTLHRATCDEATGVVSDLLLFELLKEDWTRGAGDAA